MGYLFAAFAAVWVGLFFYVYLLVRRSEVLTREVAMLREQQSQKVARPASSSPAPAGRPRAEPS